MDWVFGESLLCYIYQKQNGLWKHFLRSDKINNKGGKKRKEKERRGWKGDRRK